MAAFIYEVVRCCDDDDDLQAGAGTGRSTVRHSGSIQSGSKREQFEYCEVGQRMEAGRAATRNVGAIDLEQRTAEVEQLIRPISSGLHASPRRIRRTGIVYVCWRAGADGMSWTGVVEIDIDRHRHRHRCALALAQ